MVGVGVYEYICRCDPLGQLYISVHASQCKRQKIKDLACQECIWASYIYIMYNDSPCFPHVRGLHSLLDHLVASLLSAEILTMSCSGNARAKPKSASFRTGSTEPGRPRGYRNGMKNDENPKSGRIPWEHMSSMRRNI